MVSEQRVRCSLGVWRSALLLLLLLLLVQLAATQNAECAYQCTPLTQCPELILLLKKPTAENLYALRQMTCSKGADPLVCCPKTSVPPHSTSLLPNDCGHATLLEMIYGGTEAPIDSNPWLAALGYSEAGVSGLQFLCSGSVISERYVLTAATCVHSSVLRNRQLKFIRLGEWDLSTEVDCETTFQGFKYCAPPVQNFTHDEIITHPDYNVRESNSDDIALIRLSRPVDFSRLWIQPVCLPNQDLDVRRAAGQQKPLVAGWGFTESGSSSNKVLHVVVPFVDDESCNATYKGKLVDGQLCLGGRDGQDACLGDSGSPAVITGPRGPPFLQIGLVSYGALPCGQKGKASVYTSVSHYRNWIEQNMRP